ncbi:MAG: allophanate hydrolase subunit 1 [Cytophagaceae bacterium]|jgi:inhibitor of KinA|nr:allophanate hydrolase subunit 1 [Cytophagaceae bacterium]
MEKTSDYRLTPQSDFSFLLEPQNPNGMPSLDWVQSVFLRCHARLPDWIEHCIPAFQSILICLHPQHTLSSFSGIPNASDIVTKLDYWVKDCLAQSTPSSTVSTAVTRTIPVCYDPILSPSVNTVCHHLHLSLEELIQWHTASTYTVFFMGFLPGFAYMGTIPPPLRLPRKPIPDSYVPKGSVGIADAYTGIYPCESPGGWNIIGRTPIDCLLPDPLKPTLLQPGDQVQFYSITLEEWQHWSS